MITLWQDRGWCLAVCVYLIMTRVFTRLHRLGCSQTHRGAEIMILRNEVMVVCRQGARQGRMLTADLDGLGGAG
jgi:hypothetical protein